MVRPEGATMKSPQKPTGAHKKGKKGQTKAIPPAAPTPQASHDLSVSRGDDPLLELVRTMLQPTVQAACTVSKYVDARVEGGGLDLPSLVAELGAQAKAANGGDLGRPEAMLIAQAHSLDAIFGFLVRSARLNLRENLNGAEVLLRPGLRAQSQCRATLETLAMIKNPGSVSFVRQANIAAGPQQVNNAIGEGPRARELESKQGKLLEAQNGERLDSGAKGAASAANPQLEAVEAVHRTKDRRG